MIRTVQPHPSPSARKAAHPVRAGRILISFACLALLARARIAGGLAPFAPACFAAGLRQGMSPFVMLAGCALGCMAGGVSEAEMLPLMYCAGVWLLYGAEKLAFKKIGDREELHDFLTGAYAGISVLLPGVMLSGGIMYNLLSSALAAVISSLMAPALISGLGIRPGRRLLMPEEQLSAALLLMLSLTGLRSLPFCGRFLSAAASGLTVLAFSHSGAGMGALAGLAAGTALTLGGSDPFTGSALGLCGLLAGCVRTLPRGAACIALMLGNTLTVSWGLGYTIGAMDLPPLLTACAAYCLIPTRQLNRLKGWISPSFPHADPERLAIQLRRRAAERLSRLSEVFGELADGYGEKESLPGEHEIISAVRHAQCDGCDGYAECWMGDTSKAGRLMCRMAAEALTGKEITKARDLPPDLLRHCRRSAQIDRRALPALSELAEKRRSELKRGEARGLTAKQFREAQRMLDALSTQLKSGGCVNREYAHLARAALDRAGIRAGDVTAMLDGRLEIACVLKDGVWNAKSARYVAALLSDELGLPLSPVMKNGRVPGECELRLLQAPALTAVIGTASCAAEAGQPCGDSLMAEMLPDGRLIAAVSDGMGHGEAAAKESRRCISLLRKFVGAGVDRDAALTAVNALLMMKGGEEMFATADLCVVDLYSGTAMFSKLGACRSFVLRERGMTQIAGGRLPLGILDRVEPANGRAEVHPGEMIVMFSDGIADEMKDGQTEALTGVMKKVRHMKPDEAAKEILAWAQKRDEGGKRDDMSVIALRILARPLRPAP